MKSFPSVTALLQDLIRTSSVNPAGDPGTDKVGEGAIAELVAEYLRALGAEVELREVYPGRPNVLGHFPNRAANGKKLLLAPHLDTVSVLGMTIDPFGGEVRQGKIYGRGATDTKGSIAAQLRALYECREHLDRLDYEIWFAGLIGEEAGNDGAIALAEQFQPDFVIAGEPTRLQVVHAHKGAMWFEVETAGRAAHGSLPEVGENAIYKMADLVSWLNGELIPELKQTTSDPVLGSCTLNVGIISGGSKVNIVPDQCRIEIDCRTVPSQNTHKFATQLEERVQARCAGAKTRLTRQAPPLYTDPQHPLIRQLQKLGSSLAGAPWFCDAAIFSQKGVPAIAFGPGSIEQAHTEDEWIAIADLEAGTQFLGEFLRSLRAP